MSRSKTNRPLLVAHILNVCRWKQIYIIHQIHHIAQANIVYHYPNDYE